MTECYLQHDNPRAVCVCDDCRTEAAFEDLNLITDIEQRVSPGYVAPAGQCPHCGALAYLKEPETFSAQFKAAAFDDLLAALTMVRDADNDCRLDGLPTIPQAARARIDAAIAKAEGEAPSEKKDEPPHIRAHEIKWEDTAVNPEEKGQRLYTHIRIAGVDMHVTALRVTDTDAENIEVDTDQDRFDALCDTEEAGRFDWMEYQGRQYFIYAAPFTD